MHLLLIIGVGLNVAFQLCLFLETNLEADELFARETHVFWGVLLSAFVEAEQSLGVSAQTPSRFFGSTMGQIEAFR